MSVRLNEKMLSEMKLLEIIDEIDSHFKTWLGVFYGGDLRSDGQFEKVVKKIIADI
jgi:hypothetical protein